MTDLIKRLNQMQRPGAESDLTVMRAEAAAELTRLRAEVEAYKADAERYRWIRTYAGYAMPGALVRPDTEDEMDAAIDAARAALNQETK